MNRLLKDLEFTVYTSPLVKAGSSGERRLIRGYASVGDVLDRQNEVITLGALMKAREDLLKNHTIFYEHKHSEFPIGKTIAVDIDEKGLLITVEISKGEHADTVWTLIQEGILDSFSIGGRVLESEERRDKKGNLFNEITQIELFETSVVGLPANPAAKFELVSKSFGMAITEQMRKREVSNMAKETPKEVETKKDSAGNALSPLVITDVDGTKNLNETKEQVTKSEEKVETKKEVSEEKKETKTTEKSDESKEEVSEKKEEKKETTEKEVVVKTEKPKEEVSKEKEVEKKEEAKEVSKEKEVEKTEETREERKARLIKEIEDIEAEEKVEEEVANETTPLEEEKSIEEQLLEKMSEILEAIAKKKESKKSEKSEEKVETSTEEKKEEVKELVATKSEEKVETTKSTETTEKSEETTEKKEESTDKKDIKKVVKIEEAPKEEKSEEKETPSRKGEVIIAETPYSSDGEKMEIDKKAIKKLKDKAWTKMIFG